MKHTSALICGAVALLGLSATGAAGQAVSRNYERGPVTVVQQVEVMPGQLNAYMRMLANTWRVSMEEGKHAGAILSYNIEQPIDARAGEPNLYLIVVYKDLQSIQRPYADADRSTAAIYGSLDKAQAVGMERESLRKSRGSMILQGLQFK